VTFPAEIVLAIEVEVLAATRATRGRYHDWRERGAPGEPAQVALAVWLGTNGGRIDLAPDLPADVLEVLVADALERVQHTEP
jgi:hypothetical protein